MYCVRVFPIDCERITFYNDTQQTDNMGKEDVTEKQSSLEDLKADESKVEPLKEKLIQLIEDEALDADEVRPVCEDENYIRRCLVASMNDEKKAYKVGASGLRWRSKYKPSQIKLGDFPTAAAQDVWQFAGSAKNGWPVVFGQSSKWNPWKYGTDEYIRSVAFMLETCEKAMDPADPFARIYMILDMKGMSVFYNDLRKLRHFAKLTSEYYPERCLGVAVNSDLVTSVLWKLFSPMLGKRTRDGVCIFRPNTFDKFLEANIGMEITPPSLGGARLEEWPPMTPEIADSFRWGSNNSALLKRHETDETVVEVETLGVVDTA